MHTSQWVAKQLWRMFSMYQANDRIAFATVSEDKDEDKKT